MKLPANKVTLLVIIAAFLIAAYQMTASQVILLPTLQHYNLHIGLALLVVFSAMLEKSTGKTWRTLIVVALLLSVVCWAYIHIFQIDLQLRPYFNTPPDYIIGAILIVLVIIGAWEAFGPIIPAIAIGVVIYPFVGRYLPEPFTCQAQSVLDTISYLSVSLSAGVFSRLLPISANYVFLFILFGGLLVSTGATRFFMEVGKLVGSRVRSGPGLSAVVSSALVGSVTGSVAANIAITGSFTIPLMKKVGYEPHQAGGIECAASTGGFIMPPVMGAGAFIMAGLSGIPYIKIIRMAIIPAILYFFSCFLYVYFRGERLLLTQYKEKVNVRELLLSAPSFIGPLLVIIILLFTGKSVTYTAFWAIISVIVIPLFRKETRPSLGDYLKGIREGAIAGAGYACVLAAAGLIYSTFTYTGLGIKLAGGIQEWSGGYLLVAMFIIAAISMLFGMVGIGAAAYIIVSIFGVSALMKMGIPLGTAHYFILFSSVFGYVTPPVANAAIVASKLAACPYMKTSIEATKAAFAGFLLPYMFIMTPILLLMPQPPFEAVTGIIATVLTIIAFQVSFVGYYLRVCGVLERIVAVATALLLLIFILTGNHITLLFIAGIALFVLLTFWQLRQRRSMKLEETVT
ncbi:hypothetical protein ES703_23104 [subsurface metagenome]